jgi:hypothetical protein
VRIFIPRLRLTRTGIFIILAALVALLGAAAKHSQYDGRLQSGYLSKAVKMEGTRVEPHTGSEPGQVVSSPMTEIPLVADVQPVFRAPAVACFTPVSLSSPPLRA